MARNESTTTNANIFLKVEQLNIISFMSESPKSHVIWIEFCSNVNSIR